MSVARSHYVQITSHYYRFQRYLIEQKINVKMIYLTLLMCNLHIFEYIVSLRLIRYSTIINGRYIVSLMYDVAYSDFKHPTDNGKLDSHDIHQDNAVNISV